MEDLTFESVSRRIHDFIQNTFLANEESETISPDYPLMSTGIIDSVSMLMLINYLEETFDLSIEIHDIDRERFNTITRITGLVLGKSRKSRDK